jgi:hypothetical protein
MIETDTHSASYVICLNIHACTINKECKFATAGRRISHIVQYHVWLMLLSIGTASPVNQCYFFGRQGVRGRQKINCLGLWRSKTIFFGGGWRPSGRQVINSTGELWHSRTPTNGFGSHGLAGGILRISSSSNVRIVYRHIQHRAAPRPPGCKGGSVVMNQRDK